jgi:23S rRNA G2069 N7-methylase RlmK/C1962 C5-methylase RlmI
MVLWLNRILLVCLVAMLIPACAGMQERDKLTKLDKTLREYAAHLRWARYFDAHDHIYARDGSKPGLDVDRYDDYRIASMNIIRSDLNEDKTEAVVYAEIQYYSDTTGTIRKVNEVQDWWYHEENKRWYMEGDLPTLE